MNVVQVVLLGPTENPKAATAFVTLAPSKDLNENELKGQGFLNLRLAHALLLLLSFRCGVELPGHPLRWGPQQLISSTPRTKGACDRSGSMLLWLPVLSNRQQRMEGLEPGIHVSLDVRSDAAMFQKRMMSMTASGKAFGPLTLAPWAATALSYMKEIEILTARKISRGEEDQGKNQGMAGAGTLPSGERLHPRGGNDSQRSPSKMRSETGAGVGGPALSKAGRWPWFPFGPMKPSTRGSLKKSMHETGHDDPLAVDFCLDFPRWRSSLFVNCLRSRTPFAAFLSAKSTSPSREKPSPSSSVFPLPVPSWSPLERMPTNASSRQRRSIHFARAFHTVIMALNFGSWGHLLEGTSALEHFLTREKRRRPHKRHKDRRLAEGDFLHEDPFRQAEDGLLHCSFKAMLQGDHAGVEIACSAHGQLLKNAGMLVDDEMLTGRKPLVAQHCAQGLCIDDYFCVSVHPKGSSSTSFSARCFAKAQECYLRGLLRSADRTSLKPQEQKRLEQISQVTDRRCKNPVRYGLSWISLMLAQLPTTSDGLRLSPMGGGFLL